MRSLRFSTFLVVASLLAACSQTAPPVATSAALPDWSGVWVITEESLHKGASAGGLDEKSAHDQTLVPLKPQYQQQRTQWAMKLLRGTADHSDNRLGQCKPVGMPEILLHPMMTEYLITPDRVTVLFEDGEVRRIYTDGRGHPPEAEQEHGYLGHSIGHWEGSTLIVDTMGISPQVSLLFASDIRVTNNTHIVEHIFLKDAQRLQIDTVISDDELFTSPYAYTRTYERSPLPIQEPSCASRNRDSDVAVDLTPPPP